MQDYLIVLIQILLSRNSVIIMGLCASGDPNKTNIYFHQDSEVQYKTDIYKPNTSSLFNTLRKPADMIVLNPGSTRSEPLFTNTYSIDFQTTKPNYLKTLINFKKLIFIGTYEDYKQNIIKKIKSYTSCNRFYILNESTCNSFLSQYPLFRAINWQNDKLTTSQVPILVIDSRDIPEHSGSYLKIYVHSSSKKDMNIYHQIGINDENSIINQPQSIPPDQIKKYYVSSLIRNVSKNIVMLHSSKIDSTTLSQIFIQYLKTKYQIPVPYISIYLSKSLPKSNSVIAVDNKSQIILTDPSTSKAKNATDKFKILFQKLQNQQGVQKCERSFNLLNTLITNIYSHGQNEEMYRKIKKTNKQINELLVKYKYGKQLLDQLGFRQEGDNWVNTVESKYLKVFKTDFDLGYKQYKSKQSND